VISLSASLKEQVVCRTHTLSGLIVFIATSMAFVTLCMFTVTTCIVLAVCTRPATASTREASWRRLSFSPCFRTAFWAYILAISWLPCFMAWEIPSAQSTPRRQQASSYLLDFCSLRLLCLASLQRISVQLFDRELPSVSCCKDSGVAINIL
jgi:hypothetical protein